MELYKKYRPKRFEDIVGQGAAVAFLSKMLQEGNLPHTVLFSGPSGTGKTTLARILAEELECDPGDFLEINCADFKGVETVRTIRRHSSVRPLMGKVRIWLIDEAHKLTNDAQNALLKLLEDTPDHVYFFLATTDPQKLLRTVLTRCTEVKLRALTEKEILVLLDKVLREEKRDLSDAVLDEIAKASEGSARKALVLLEQALHVEGEENQIEAIQSTSEQQEEAIELVRSLFAPQKDWATTAALLKKLEMEDPETIRWLTLAYARKVLLSGGRAAGQAFKIIDIFSRPFYESKHAGLAAACWEAIFK